MRTTKSETKKQAICGQKFGRWTVLDEMIFTDRGEKKWLCRCDCGTERYVLERSLKYGGSLSCGCLQKEAMIERNSLNLNGQTFGDLTVLHKAEKQRKNGGVWWTCRCSCGNNYDAPATVLITGRRTHCGSREHEKNYAFQDITNQRYRRLTALYPTKKRDKKGSVMWHCRCDCGTEIDVSYNNLVYGNMKSCGCQKKEHDQALSGFLTHVDGTSLDMIKSRKVPTNSTTGIKGVYFIKGKYIAKIVFQKKQYHLGRYDDIEDAATARKEAEETLNNAVISHYEKWKIKAESDPVWAENNPVKYHVEKDGVAGVSVVCLPIMDEKI